jgi:hypothetical protein
MVPLPDIACRVCPREFKPHNITSHAKNCKIMCCKKCLRLSDAKKNAVIEQWLACEIKNKLRQMIAESN